MKRTRVIFVLDESGSMGHLSGKVLETLQGYITSLREATDDENRYEVNFVKFSDSVKIQNRTFWDVSSTYADVKNILYRPSGGTALLDAMGEAIDACEGDNDTSYLMIVLTDGQENASVRCTKKALQKRLAEIEATDRWTVVVNCPKEDVSYVESLGLLKENIKPWEATTKGMETLSRDTTQGLKSYTAARSAGQTRSRSFYADTSNLSTNTVAQALTDITPKVVVVRRQHSDNEVIREFCVSRFGRYDIGRVFYELIKSEKVQSQKEIVILDETTGKFYTGWTAARQLLGLPLDGKEVRLKPGTMGTKRVFVQSTSVNRKLADGQRVIKIDG